MKAEKARGPSGVTSDLSKLCAEEGVKSGDVLCTEGGV